LGVILFSLVKTADSVPHFPLAFMAPTLPTKKNHHAARLALAGAWVVCVVWFFRPVAKGTVEGFLNPKNEMDYGWLVVPVALFMVWFVWEKLRVAVARPTWGGVFLVAFSFALHMLGQHTGNLFYGQLAMILSIPAVAWTGWGKQVARLLVFPCAFLLFIIPLNFGTEFLCWLSGTVAAKLMNGVGFGMELFYEIEDFGKGVFLTNPAHDFLFKVEDVCSGRRSVVAILASSALYVFFHYKTLRRMFLLMACSIPFVLVANILRIILMCVSAVFFGEEKTVANFHDIYGLIMFAVAVVLLFKFGDTFFKKFDKDRG